LLLAELATRTNAFASSLSDIALLTLFAVDIISPSSSVAKETVIAFPSTDIESS